MFDRCSLDVCWVFDRCCIDVRELFLTFIAFAWSSYGSRKHIKLHTNRWQLWTAIIFAPGNEKHDFTWKSNGRICQNVIDISVEAGKVWGNLIYLPWPPIRLKSVVPLLLTSPRSFREAMQIFVKTPTGKNPISCKLARTRFRINGQFKNEYQMFKSHRSTNET